MPIMTTCGSSTLPATSKHRHRKSVMVTLALLAEILKNRGTRITACKGLPVDARLVGYRFDAQIEAVELIFEHESFPVIEDGVMVLPSRIDCMTIEPSAFCEPCRRTWRDYLDDFYASENIDLDVVSPK